MALPALVFVAGIAMQWLCLLVEVPSAWREYAVFCGLVIISLVASLGGFLIFSDASWAWVDWLRGWRVRLTEKGRHIYEEFGDDGQFRSIEIFYEPLEKRYAPRCRITVPGVDEWTAMTPTWAHGRRNAILERLRQWGGREGWNAPVTFVTGGKSTAGTSQPRRADTQA